MRRLAMIAACLVLAGCHKSGSENPGALDEPYCDAISGYAAAADCTDFQAQAARITDGNAAVNAPNPMNRGDTVSLSVALAADQPKPVAHSALQALAAPMHLRNHVIARDVATPTPVDAASAGEGASAGSGAAPSPANTPSPTYAPTPGEVVAPMPGHTEVFTVAVGEHVKVTLDGDAGFEITPRSPATQLVHLGAPYPATLWSWDIKAVHGGAHALTITTVVQAIDRNGRYHDLVGSPHAYAFTVNVTLLGKVEDAVQLAPTWIKAVTAVVVALTTLVTALVALRTAARPKTKGQDGG